MQRPHRRVAQVAKVCSETGADFQHVAGDIRPDDGGPVSLPVPGTEEEIELLPDVLVRRPAHDDASRATSATGAALAHIRRTVSTNTR